MNHSPGLDEPAQGRCDALPEALQASTACAARSAAGIALVAGVLSTLAFLLFVLPRDNPSPALAASGMVFAVVVAGLGVFIKLRNMLESLAHTLRIRLEQDHAYRAWFDTQADAVLIMDQESRRILAANQAARSLYGYRGEELLGQGADLLISDLPPPGSPPTGQVLHHRSRDGQLHALPTLISALTFGSRPAQALKIAGNESPARAGKERQFVEALEKVQHVLYRFNPTHECYDYISAKAEEWLGTSVDVLCSPGGWQHFARHLTPQELGLAWASINEALTRPGNDPLEISVEYRLSTAAGKSLWIHDSMTLLRHTDGSLAAIVGAASDLTEERATREYLDVTLRSMGEAVIATDMEGRVTLMNPVAETLTGWTEQDAGGRPLDEVLHIVDEESGEALSSSTQQILHQGGPLDPARRTLLEDRQGRRRPITSSGAPLLLGHGEPPLGAVLVFRDQTEESRARQAIADQQARYRALVENAPVGILHFTRDLMISYCNNRLAEILQSSPAQLDGVDLHFLGDDKILAILNDALAGRRGAYDGPFVSPVTDSLLILSIRVAPEVDADGNVYGGVGIVEDRTALLETEAQLRNTEERYVLAQRGTNEGLWDWDPKTRHLFLSTRLLSLLGLKSDTLRTTGEEWLKLIHPEDRAGFRRDFIAHLRGETDHFESEYRVADKDGRFHWVLARGLAHRNQQGRAVRVVGSIGDITARKLAEEQLKSERDFSRGLIDSLPAPFFLFDHRGRLVLWNRFVSELTGLEDEHLQNVAAESLVIAEQEAVMAHRIDSALVTGEASAEVMLRRKDKEPVPFLVVGRRVVLDGSPHIIGVGTDLTERKFAERAIKRLNTELERRVVERTSQLSAALSELESFSYSVSHDLRAPLRAIEGYSSILGSDYGDRLDDEAKELLRRVRAAVHRMGQLIDDLLTLSRVSRKELERRPVDLSLLAQSICDDLQQQETQRSVRVNIAPSLKVEGDPSLMRTVLENLLGNAWKFTGRVEHAEIRFEACEHEGVQAFVVRDNGAGFDMRYRENLFRPFQRLHSDREFPGTGIGLATVARIVRRHGGEVWAEGEVGVGASLYFSIGQNTPLANPA